MIPGIKKLLNGECSSMDKGICSISPSGASIKAPPPPMAPIPKNAIKNNKRSLDLFFIMVFLMIKYRNVKNAINIDDKIIKKTKPITITGLVPQ